MPLERGIVGQLFSSASFVAANEDDILFVRLVLVAKARDGNLLPLTRHAKVINCTTDKTRMAVVQKEKEIMTV